MNRAEIHIIVTGQIAGGQSYHLHIWCLSYGGALKSGE